MDYKTLMGYNRKTKKKKPIKEVVKKPSIADNLKEEFGLNEGPAYEYSKYAKNIEKAENNLAIEVNNLVKLLTKKGLKSEATEVASSYMKPIRKFKNDLDKIIDGLM